MFQASIFRKGVRVHTHIPSAHFSYTMFVTHPTTGHTTSQHADRSQLVQMVNQHEAVFSSYYTDPFF